MAEKIKGKKLDKRISGGPWGGPPLGRGGAGELGGGGEAQGAPGEPKATLHARAPGPANPRSADPPAAGLGPADLCDPLAAHQRDGADLLPVMVNGVPDPRHAAVKELSLLFHGNPSNRLY